jgi:hypothetical protein
VRPPRAVIDERERFRFGNTSRLAKIPLRCSASRAGRSKTRADGDSRHLGERVERLALRLGECLARSKVAPRFKFRVRRRYRTSRVEYHSFRPFLIRVDPNVDPPGQRDVGRPRTSNRHGRAPVRGEQRRDKEASHPTRNTSTKHGHSLSADLPSAVRGGRPR